MQGKIGVHTGKDGNKMAFPGVHSFFRRIFSVRVGRRQLVLGAGLENEIFELCREFIDQILKIRAQATIDQMLVKFGESMQNFSGTA